MNWTRKRFSGRRKRKKKTKIRERKEKNAVQTESEPHFCQKSLLVVQTWLVRESGFQEWKLSRAASVYIS